VSRQDEDEGDVEAPPVPRTETTIQPGAAEAVSGEGEELTTRSLGEEAAASVRASVRAERERDRGPSGGGMPAETDFVTPRQGQGSEGRRRA
jgi:hypothetical protein